MKPTPRSRYLTYKHPVYAGCTLNVCTVVFAGVITALALLAILCGLIFGRTTLFLLVFFLCSLGISRVILGYISRYQADKQAGFMTVRFRLWLHNTLGGACPYVTRRGRWSTRRKI